MKVRYFKLLLFSLLALGTACSKEELPDLDEEILKLVIQSNSTTVEVDAVITFEVTAEDQVVEDADIYLDGNRIESNQYQFDQTGTATVVAKKSGYKDSDPLIITIKEKEFNVDVYVLGSPYYATQDQVGPGYWKNGESMPLLQKTDYPGDAFSSIYNSIHVSNDHVYVSGSTLLNSSDAVAFYWDNETYISLTDRNDRAISGNSANDILELNSNVYIAGGINTSRDVYNAVYWKNGELTFLTNQGEGEYFSAFATSIDVLGDDVYTAGNIGGTPTYWKNTAKISLNGQGEAKSIAVDANGDVYVAGFEYGNDHTAKYWKNGVEVNLGTSGRNSEAHSVFVENGDVYVAGFEEVERPSGAGYVTAARYWKNGEAVNLTDLSYTTHAYAIFVLDGDVFVAGTASKPNQRLSAVYWRNGEEISLSDGSEREVANDIFIVRK